jgi:hypothetical protein
MVTGLTGHSPPSATVGNMSGLVLSTGNDMAGTEPDGRTVRLMVLVAVWPGKPHDSWNVQQPAVGRSTMLGPPAIVTTGWDSSRG